MQGAATRYDSPFSGCIGMVGRSAYVQTVSFRGCFKKINRSAARRGCQRVHEDVNIRAALIAKARSDKTDLFRNFADKISAATSLTRFQPVI